MILLTSTYSCVSVKAQGDNIIAEGQAIEIAKREAKILGYDVEQRILGCIFLFGTGESRRNNKGRGFVCIC